MKISRTAIFLFELMFVILVFTISAAVCSAIFAKAYAFSTRSHDLNMAMLRAESAAEAFKSGGNVASLGDDPGAAAKSMDDLNTSGGAIAKAKESVNDRNSSGAAIRSYYDEDWNRIKGNDPAHGVYLMECQSLPGRSKEVSACKITVSRMEKSGLREELIRLHVKRYEGSDTGS
jgi:hypothetical protein